MLSRLLPGRLGRVRVALPLSILREGRGFEPGGGGGVVPVQCAAAPVTVGVPTLPNWLNLSHVERHSSRTDSRPAPSNRPRTQAQLVTVGGFKTFMRL